MSANHDSDVYSGAAFIFPAAEAKVGLTFTAEAGSKVLFVDGLSDPEDLKRTLLIGDRVWVESTMEMREIMGISYSNNTMIVDRPFAAGIVAEPLFISKQSIFSEVSISVIGADAPWDTGNGFKTLKDGVSRSVVKGDKSGTGTDRNVNNFVIDLTASEAVISYTI